MVFLSFTMSGLTGRKPKPRLTVKKGVLSKSSRAHPNQSFNVPAKMRLIGIPTCKTYLRECWVTTDR